MEGTLVSINEWINKMWYISTIEYYSALKRTEIITHTATCVTNEDIMPRETSQSPKDKYCIISLIWGIYNSQIYRDRKYNGGWKGLEGGKNECFSMGRVSVLQVLETGCTTMWMYSTLLSSIHLKIIEIVNFMSWIFWHH